jgi:hypothetical protein
MLTLVALFSGFGLTLSEMSAHVADSLLRPRQDLREDSCLLHRGRQCATPAVQSALSKRSKWRSR